MNGLYIALILIEFSFYFEWNRQSERMEDKTVLDLFGKFVNLIMSVLSPLGQEVEPDLFELNKM